MRRKFLAFALLLAGALTLQACDKCGGIQDFRYPTLPLGCRGGAPAR